MSSITLRPLPRRREQRIRFSEPPFGVGLIGNVCDLSFARSKPNSRLSIGYNWTFFASSYGWVFFKVTAVAFLNFYAPFTADTYLHTKYGANRSSIRRDIHFCVFFKMVAAVILNFQKMLCWTWRVPFPYLSAYQIWWKSKFDGDTPFCVFFEMAATAILDLLIPILG